MYNSVYAFSENKVVAHVELEGLESCSINDKPKLSKASGGFEAKVQVRLGPAAGANFKLLGEAGGLHVEHNTMPLVTLDFTKDNLIDFESKGWSKQSSIEGGFAIFSASAKSETTFEGNNIIEKQEYGAGVFNFSLESEKETLIENPGGPNEERTSIEREGLGVSQGGKYSILGLITVEAKVEYKPMMAPVVAEPFDGTFPLDALKYEVKPIPEIDTEKNE